MNGKKYGLRRPTDKRPNQYTANPKQEKFISLYFNPRNRETFGNAHESAIQAGYSESYACKIASQGLGNQWIKESRMLAQFTPDHITQALQGESMDPLNRGSERIKALELMAKMQGMLVDRSQNVNVNIEAAIDDLK